MPLYDGSKYPHSELNKIILCKIFASKIAARNVF